MEDAMDTKRNDVPRPTGERPRVEQDLATVWARLAAPIDASRIAWRQDGKPVTRDGKAVARQVAYIEAGTVRERLDAVVPGEWDLTLEALSPIEDEGERLFAFKARVQVLGVIREDVGTGKDYKAASTDAFKRAAVRFGIAHELYDMPAKWAPVGGEPPTPRRLTPPRGVPAVAPDPTPVAEESPTCPKCGGRMFDNRLTKRNAKAPDFRCRDRSCDGLVWPPKPPAGPTPDDGGGMSPLPSDDLPF
jgi:hypothetical protein